MWADASLDFRLERFDANGGSDGLLHDDDVAFWREGRNEDSLEDDFCDSTSLANHDALRVDAGPLFLQAGTESDPPPEELLEESLDALGAVEISELGLAGPGARGCPGETQCLFCLAHLPVGPSQKRWHHNVQHPGAAAKLLSSRSSPSSGVIECWVVQLRPRRGPQLRLSSKEGAPWFLRKVDSDGNKARRVAS